MQNNQIEKLINSVNKFINDALLCGLFFFAFLETKGSFLFYFFPRTLAVNSALRCFFLKWSHFQIFTWFSSI